MHYVDGHFINDNYDRIIGDLFITIHKQWQVYTYHVEFQTLNDQSMVIRMSSYGFAKALEVADFMNNDKQSHQIIEFPKQLVNFLEENENIGEELSLLLHSY